MTRPVDTLPDSIRRAGRSTKQQQNNGITPISRRVVAQSPRHLIYHLHPILNSVWRQNIDELRRRASLFTGRRIISVAIGDNTESEEVVQRELSDLAGEIHFTANNRNLGEAPTLLSALNDVVPLPGLTFYAHAKGVTHRDTSVVFDVWTRLMYTLLDRTNEVYDHMFRHGFCGLIRSSGQPVAQGQYQWYYPGSFYWFRNDVVARRGWNANQVDRFYSEQFPSRIVRFTEAAALHPELFLDNPYDRSSWLPFQPGLAAPPARSSTSRSFGVQASEHPPGGIALAMNVASETSATESRQIDSRESVTYGPVAVIITSHNYGRYLGDCVESVLAQSCQPRETVVIDDSSDDNTRDIAVGFASHGVKYFRVENCNVYLTRRAGLLKTESPFVVFLDADDKIGPQYLAECLAGMMMDDAVGIMTSGLTLFGMRQGELRHEPCNLERSNWIHSGSMVRRAALEMSDAYESDPPPNLFAHDDWFVWKRVARAGWKTDRIPSASYYYRQHSSSMMAGTMRTGSYYDRAALGLEPITLVIPLCRERYFERLRDWVERQTGITDVVLIDSSDDASFRNRVKTWLASLPVKSYHYIVREPSHGLPDADRANSKDTYRAVQVAMPRIYRHLRDVKTEFVMVVEDDVLPPVDAIDRLMRDIDMNVAAVSGVVPSRYQLGYAVGGETFGTSLPLVERDGVQQVAYTGFGCLLLRKSAILLTSPFHAGGETGNFDVEFSRSVRELGWHWLMDWSVRCEHGELS